jgi:CHAD domain-containing protein
MPFNPVIARIHKPLSDEHARAQNAGRTRDADVCREMLCRLETVSAFDQSDPTFALVTKQAMQLLHEIWEKHPLSIKQDDASDGE